MDRFQGKVAVVSGGARGIGWAVTEQFALEGAKVAIVSRNEDSCSKAAQEINRTHPGAARHYAVDVADFEAMQETGKQIIADLGEVNILVNNAGITRDKLLLLMKENDWDAVLNTNLKGTFNAIKAFQRSLLRASDPRIINISSVTGLLGNAGQAGQDSRRFDRKQQSLGVRAVREIAQGLHVFLGCFQRNCFLFQLFNLGCQVVHF